MRRGRFRTICVAAMVGCLSAGQTNAASYSFTKAIDSTGALNAISGVSLNDDGAISIRATLDNGGEGIFSFDGVRLDTIADTSGEFSSLTGLTINAVGDVAFLANYDIGFAAGGQAIFISDGQTLRPIVDTSGEFFQFSQPTVNDHGEVAFRAQLDNGAWGIFRTSGGTVTTLASENGPFDHISMGYFENIPSINNNGVVVFSAWLDNGTRGIFKSSGDAFETVVDSDDGFSAFDWSPAVNDSGEIVFGASRTNGPNGIYLHGEGANALIAEDSAVAHGLTNGAVNEAGDVAFIGCFLDQDGCAAQGILTGSDPIADTLIREGDPLFGATVTSIGLNYGLNDSGRIAFAYTLNNGQSGVAFANPTLVPEPGGSLQSLLATIIVAGIRPGLRASCGG